MAAATLPAVTVAHLEATAAHPDATEVVPDTAEARRAARVATEADRAAAAAALVHRRSKSNSPHLTRGVTCHCCVG